MSEETITGRVAMAGDTEVVVVPVQDDIWHIRLTTDGNVTRFNLKHETLGVMLFLMGRQGGVLLPGGHRIVYQEQADA